MDKCLYFHICRDPAAYLPDVLQPDLTGEDYALSSHLVKLNCGLIIHNARLGRDVKLHFRRVLLYHGDHSEIARYCRVNSAFLCGGYIFRELLDLAVERYRIAGQVNLYAAFMRETHSAVEPVHVKVFCTGAHSVACRSKKLYLVHLVLFLLAERCVYNILLVLFNRACVVEYSIAAAQEIIVICFSRI